MRRVSLDNLPNKKYKSYKAVTYPDLRWARRDIKTTSLLPNIIEINGANRRRKRE